MSTPHGLRLAVLGDPVEHSLSPLIHSVLLELSGIAGSYMAVRADVVALKRLIAEMRAGEWTGFNVTMPLKAEAAAAADILSEDAARAVSVNTLGLRDGSVFGETTDCSTFRALLADERFDPEAPVLVIGAGGSAAAALVAVQGSRPVFLSSRRLEQAADLTGRIGGEVLEWGIGMEGSVIVNATPLGMRGESLPGHMLEGATGLIDLPYGPDPTPAVLATKDLGIPVVEGFEFLVRQAMTSFLLWTGVELPYETVHARLRNT